jgi:hypothetical protein
MLRHYTHVLTYCLLALPHLITSQQIQNSDEEGEINLLNSDYTSELQLLRIVQTVMHKIP